MTGVERLRLEIGGNQRERVVVPAWWKGLVGALMREIAQTGSNQGKIMQVFFAGPV